MIQQFLEKNVKPMFEPGGKLHVLWPIYDAQETFLLTPQHVTETGPHIRDSLDVKRVMIMVVIALIPTVFMGAWNAGYQQIIGTATLDGRVEPTFVNCMIYGLWAIMPIIITSYAVGGAWEVLFAIIRRHQINEGFLVTGLLFPLTLPPSMPLWMVAVGITFGVVVGKEVFGGTGMNILNPALTARAFVFFAFPAAMSGNTVWINGLQQWRDGSYQSMHADGATGATILLTATTSESVQQYGTASAVEILNKAGQEFSNVDYDWWNSFIGFEPGSIGETSALACLLGAVLLILTGLGSWRTMLGVVLGGWACTALLNAFATPDRVPGLSLPFHWHLVAGSFAFGTVYMATDPVSSAATKTGRLIYGFLIGVLCILIRVVNPAYPEGMMLAILFMNVFAPVIDFYVIQSTANLKKQRSVAYAG